MKAIINADFYTGEEIITDKALLMEDGLIKGFVDHADIPGGTEISDVSGATVAPGYIDLQVNGGGGVLFNDDPTIEGLKAIGQAHRRLGTTSLLPTFITGDQKSMEAAISAVREALSQKTPGILGIHLEGPMLNPERSGVHDRSQMRSLDASWLVKALGGIPSLITVAPEMVESGYIRALTRSGIKVAVGHSNASATQMANAISEGASLVTHIYNACSQLTGREPGVVGMGLASRELSVSCIADGHHVAYKSIEVAIRAKKPGKFLLVTDAMPVVGSPRDSFSLGDLNITLRNGRCETSDGTLAGSALRMSDAVKNCVQRIGVPKDEAIRMATRYPGQFFGSDVSRGSIAPGVVADLVILDNELNVRQVLSEGNLVQS
jgi:N-acetylglucosamine-6-phosphate deacetylase